MTTEETTKPNTLLSILETYGNPALDPPSPKVVDALYSLNPNFDEDLSNLLYSPIKSIKEPLVHTPTDNTNEYLPEPKGYVHYIQYMIASRYSKSMSMKEVAVALGNLGYHVSSSGQLSNIWNRVETKSKLKDKPRQAQKDQDRRNEEAAAVGKKRIKRKTAANTKQLKDARAVKSAKAAIIRAEKDKKNAKVRLAKAAAKSSDPMKHIRKEPNKKTTAGKAQARVSNVTEEDSADIKATGKKVLYEPTPKQAEFHAAGEDIVLYGGAAGGGKSYAMLIDCLRFAQEEDYRGLLIRRTSPMLKELIGVSRSLYPKAFPGAKYNKSENVWYFPSGATIQFGYLDRPEDLDNYQGLPYSYIGFDEIQHQRSDEGFLYLMSRLRSANPRIQCYIRASANPGGSPWVKETFIDPAPANTTFYKGGLSYRFIPAKLEDNPYLDTPVGNEEISPYRKMLQALPEVKRKQLLEGDWLAGDDVMFQFHPAVHVTDEMPPIHWAVTNALDYGFKDPAASLWAASDPQTGRLHVYAELESLQHEHAQWAKAVKEKEGYIPQGIDRVIDASVFKMTGHIGPGVREEIRRYGLAPRPADRNREAGWNQIHQRLYVNPDDGLPMILIHSSCKKLIDQLSTARSNEKKPDDIDERRLKSHGRTHHWDLLDTLRYLCMARPQRETIQTRSLGHKSEAEGFSRYRGYFQ